VIDAFVDALDLAGMGFDLIPARTGRPAYHPGAMLKIYIYGYMNRIQSSRRLETECQRNLELMWLTGRLAPDFKTMADFRRDNGAAICAACGQFIAICRRIGMFTLPMAVVDGSRFKGVNARDKNFTRGKVKSRIGQVEEAIARYLRELDAADRHERMGFASDGARLRDKLTKLEAQMAMLKAMEAKVAEAEDHQVSLTDPDTRSMVTGLRLVGVVGYNVQTATDLEHHLIIAHEVTNSVTDRGLCRAWRSWRRTRSAWIASMCSPIGAISAVGISTIAGRTASPPWRRARAQEARRPRDVFRKKRSRMSLKRTPIVALPARC
jgi:transposase